MVTKVQTNMIDKAGAKAWVNFNGTGTVAIRDSFNVLGITDISAGKYSVVFNTAMSNANYGIFALTGEQSAGGVSAMLSKTSNPLTISTTEYTVYINNNSAAFVDAEIVTTGVFAS